MHNGKSLSHLSFTQLVSFLGSIRALAIITSASIRHVAILWCVAVYLRKEEPKIGFFPELCDRYHVRTLESPMELGVSNGVILSVSDEELYSWSLEAACLSHIGKGANLQAAQVSDIIVTHHVMEECCHMSWPFRSVWLAPHSAWFLFVAVSLEATLSNRQYRQRNVWASMVAIETKKWAAWHLNDVRGNSLNSENHEHLQQAQPSFSGRCVRMQVCCPWWYRCILEPCGRANTERTSKAKGTIASSVQSSEKASLGWSSRWKSKRPVIVELSTYLLLTVEHTRNVMCLVYVYSVECDESTSSVWFAHLFVDALNDEDPVWSGSNFDDTPQGTVPIRNFLVLHGLGYSHLMNADADQDLRNFWDHERDG